MTAVWTVETSVTFHQRYSCVMPKELLVQQHHYENLKYGGFIKIFSALFVSSLSFGTIRPFQCHWWTVLWQVLPCFNWLYLIFAEHECGRWNRVHKRPHFIKKWVPDFPFSFLHVHLLWTVKACALYYCCFWCYETRPVKDTLELLRLISPSGARGGVEVKALR